MPGTKLSQLKWEIQGWFRVLRFLEGENVHLKNRLAQILKSTDPEHLAEIEQLQSTLINYDTLFVILHRDIDLHYKNLVENFTRKESYRSVTERQKRLTSDIDKLQKGFINLKNSFNNYMQLQARN